MRFIDYVRTSINGRARLAIWLLKFRMRDKGFLDPPAPIVFNLYCRGTYDRKYCYLTRDRWRPILINIKDLSVAIK